MAVLLGLAAAASGAAPLELSATTQEPRAFGYQAGDLVSRVVLVDVPSGLGLDPESLPAVGRIGSSLELRTIRRSEQRIDGGTQLSLVLDFQVFAAPVAARVFDLPTLKLRFEGGGRSEELRIDPWPLAVAPLGPEAASPRHGLGELRPDLPPPPADTRLQRVVLALAGALALAIAGWLAMLHIGLPWWGRRLRPFGLAWQELKVERRRGALTGDAAGCLRVTRRLHAALNETAGRVLFEASVDDFLAAMPRYAPLRDDLHRFFAGSRRAFFASGNGTPATVAAADAAAAQAFSTEAAAGAEDPDQTTVAHRELQALLDLARALREVERGTA
jgi:mxaA protein